MRLDHGELPAEHVLGLAAATLLDRLADAYDDPQPGRQRAPHPQADGLVAFAEVLPALRVADEGSGDAELDEHRGRNLARVRALLVPVDVLRVRCQAGLDGIRGAS